MNELSLYHIEDELAALINTEDLVDDDVRLEFLQEIARATEQAIQKRNAVIAFLRHLELQQGNIDAEIDRLKALKDSYAHGQERVERYVVSVIEQFAPEAKRGPKRLEGSIGVLALRKNPDRVEISDESAIPQKYLVTPPPPPPRPDKAAIKKAIQAGEEVPGCDIVFGTNRLQVS